MMVREALQQGHEVGGHSVTHDFAKMTTRRSSRQSNRNGSLKSGWEQKFRLSLTPTITLALLMR